MVHTNEQDEFESALAFHRREWRVQRIGWTVITLLLVLACVGLFGGGGPLSEASVTGEGTTVEYERFARRNRQTTLTIVPVSRPAAGAVELGISSEYLQAFTIEAVTPEPTEVRADMGRLTFKFAVTSAAAPIQFHLNPERAGSQHARIFTAPDAAIDVEQFIYP